MALQMLTVAYGVRAGVVEMFTYAIFPIIAARLVLFVESGLTQLHKVDLCLEGVMITFEFLE